MSAVDRPVHPFYPSGELGTDWTGAYAACGTCGLPRSNAVHELPETPQDDISDRIIGEGDECR